MGDLIVSPGALKRIPNLEEAFAIIINGDTAPQAIGEEQYVYVRNHSTLNYGLYMATIAIASGDALSSSNLSPAQEGGLNALFDKISYNGVDVAVTIPSSGWSSSSPYVYTWTDARVTSRCRVLMDFVKGANNGEVPYLDFEKVSGGVKFTAPKKPTQNISVIIHIINAVEQSITNVSASDVATSAVDGAANVEEALAEHESSITSHGQSISTLNDKIVTKSGSRTSLQNVISVTFTRTANIITVQVEGFSSLPTGGWTNICNIPSGYVPGANVIIDIVQNTNDQCSGFQLLRFRVNASGILQIYNYGNELTYINAYVLLTYIV